MNAYARPSRHNCTAFALLIVLCLGTVTVASAQPAAPEDALFQLAKIERTLADPFTRATLSAAQWQTYAHQLSGALASGHDGLQEGALRMIIQYGDDLSLDRPAVFDVVRIYRNHPDDRMRRMAVVALGRIHDAWALDFLKRSVQFEETPDVRETILSVLDAHGVLQHGPAKIIG